MMSVCCSPKDAAIALGCEKDERQEESAGLTVNVLQAGHLAPPAHLPGLG